MTRKKICVFCGDLSSGAAVPAIAVADALAAEHDVVIVGAQTRESFWPAIELTPHRVVAVRTASGPSFVWSIPRLIRQMHADVVVCCKPTFPSLVPALINRWLHGTPVALYVDDDEIALTMPGRKLALRRRLASVYSDVYTRLADKLCRFAQVIICETSVMQRRYGGTVIPKPRNLNHLDPAAIPRNEARRRLNLPSDAFLVGFIGVPRPHKGFDELVSAVAAARSPDIKLLLVPPIGYSDPSMQEQISHLGDRVIVCTDQPSSTVRDYLAACDAIAIPQRQVAEAEGQLPAKLVEAMAMGKAIIATTVSDIPNYLEGCGLLVPPANPNALVAALEKLAADPSLRNEFGRRARERYLAQLSYDILGARMRTSIDATYGELANATPARQHAHH